MIALLLALVLTADPFSRVEVEAVLGPPVDEFSPVGELGLPYAAGTVAVSYVGADRPAFAEVAAKAPRQVLTTVLYRDGQLVAARQQRLGDPTAPVLDVTQSIKKVLRSRRS